MTSKLTNMSVLVDQVWAVKSGSPSKHSSVFLLRCFRPDQISTFFVDQYFITATETTIKQTRRGRVLIFRSTKTKTVACLKRGINLQDVFQTSLAALNAGKCFYVAVLLLYPVSTNPIKKKNRPKPITVPLTAGSFCWLTSLILNKTRFLLSSLLVMFRAFSRVWFCNSLFSVFSEKEEQSK